MAETTAAATVNLGSISRVPVGQGRCYVVGNEEIAVFRQRDGRLFATQNRCPHRHGPLSEGVIGGGQVICPLHAHRFNLKDGAGSEPGECVQVHRVKDVDGEILLSLDAPAPAPEGAEREGLPRETPSGEGQTA
jgi:NAD(P)H-dependent nitrite reductase small subunit